MLLTIRPAPVSRTRHNATSATTRPVRSQLPPPESDTVRVPSFNPALTSAAMECAAGARPSKIPMIVATANVNANTVGSSRMSVARGSTL